VSSHDKKGAAGSTSKLHQTLHGNHANPTHEEEIEGVLAGEGEEVETSAPLSYVDLQKKFTETEVKATQYWERLLRMQAEMDNLQRRVERDVANAHKYALEKFVLDLLPVVDSMERSLEMPDEDSVANKALHEGVELTLKMLMNTLEKFGVQQVSPVGEAFNPEFHQAVTVQANASVKPGTVLNALQKGYLLNNRLVRPALVIVSSA
jgi:molecular chaperone GrpE